MRIVYSEPQITYTLDFSQKGLSIVSDYNNTNAGRRVSSFLPSSSISNMSLHQDSAGRQTTLIQTMNATSNVSIGLPAQAYQDIMKYYFQKCEDSLKLSDKTLTFWGEGLEILYPPSQGHMCVYIAQKYMIHLRHTLYSSGEYPTNTIHLYYDTQNIRINFSDEKESYSAYKFIMDKMLI